MDSNTKDFKTSLKHRLYNIEYKRKNRDWIKMSNDLYRKKIDGTMTPHYRRSNQKTSWKAHGMKLCKGETWDGIFDIYSTMEECNGCARPFQPNEKRCLDHNHENGEIRGVLCYSCNKLDILKLV